MNSSAVQYYFCRESTYTLAEIESNFHGYFRKMNITPGAGFVGLAFNFHLAVRGGGRPTRSLLYTGIHYTEWVFLYPSNSTNIWYIPADAHISTPFFQKTVFFSKIFFGKPPSKIFGGMSKF